MHEKGVLAVVSGFSGAGKGTIVTKLINNYDGYALSISATTREPREGEVDGVHYFYKKHEEFEKMIEQDELYEYARYLDNYYGTPKAFVREQIAAGKDVILEIDVQGALQIKKKYPGVLLVFVTPPSIEELSRRLRGRGTETEEQIQGRLARARDEAVYMDQYDFILIVEDPETGTKKLHDLIQAVHCRPSMKKAFISDIRAQLDTERGE